MKIERKGIRGPVVALASMVCCHEPSSELILWSIGGIFYWFRPNSIEQSLIIFDYASIHGIVPQSGKDQVLLYGDKGICILNYNYVENQFYVEVKHQNLDDMVLDCQILETTNSKYLLAVGYAHNFYDLMEVSQNHNYTVLKRYQCSEKFVLFSLSFSIYSKDDIIVASGNVFGKITLWKGIESNDNSKLLNSQILGSIHQHEGVIFRLVWNNSRTKLITVSDDRTARVWKISMSENKEEIQIDPIMVCWGHICRLWDAIFLNEEENLIATCSEDSTIKIWNERSETISTFKGHLGSVWRVIKMKSQDWLISAGNESSLKFWKLQYQLTNSPQQESSTISSSLIPAWPINYNVLNKNDKPETISSEDVEVVVKRKEKSNKRNNGVSNIQITPCGKYIILMLVSGQIWLAKLNKTNSRNSRFATEEWIPVIDLGKNILLTDVHYNYEVTSSDIHLSFLVGFVDSNCLYFKVTFSENLSTEENQKFHEKAFQQYNDSHFEWKPHDQKAVNVWFSENYTNATTLPSEEGRIFITTSLKGICKLWRFHQKTVILQRVFETERFEIASSCFFKSSTRDHPGYYIIGDSRGGINIFLENSINAGVESETTAEKPIYFFNKVHATDPVSRILGSPKGFISIGHDSTINYFEEFFHCSHVYWKVVNNALTMPVHTCDQMNIIYSDDCNSNSIATSSIYLSGFHGSSFLIYDLRRNYQLMRIEGGGWKRPHSSRLLFSNNHFNSKSSQLPSALFTCPAPVGKTETELQIIGSTLHANLESPSDYPVQLGCSSFGKVSYCSVMIQHELPSVSPSKNEILSWLVVAGEDCTMKVFSYPELLLLQETTLSKNSSMKALATTSFKNEGNESKGIVVGGGGKLLYYIWLYDFEHYLNTNDHHLSTQSSFAPLQKVYVGNITPDASQDHRIMCVDVLFLNCFLQQSIPVSSIQSESSNIPTYFKADVYECLLLLSDSRGFMTIVNFQYYDYQEDFLAFSSFERNWNKKQFSVVQHLMEISSSPMLSCAFLELPFRQEPGENTEEDNEDYRFVLIAGGDSRGIVDVMLLPIQQNSFSASLDDSSVANPYFRTSLCDPVWLYEVHAQDMGTNALAMKCLRPVAGKEWDLLIGTGGDDQMLSVHFLSLSLHSILNEQGTREFEVIFKERMNNKYPYAATAALKGVSFLDSTFHVEQNRYTVGMMSLAWDQRLLRWNLNITKPSSSSSRDERKQFPITRTLFSSLQQIPPYQNQLAYYFHSPSFLNHLPKEAMERILENSSQLYEENIQFQFQCGIVVYISEIASLFTLKTQSTEQDEGKERVGGSTWLCTAVGEGFEIIQFSEK